MYSGADNTGIQTAGVFVDAHRGPAPTRICVEPKPVGASLLAKNARATRAFRQPALSLTPIAGKPAPTRICVEPKTVGASLLAKNARTTRAIRQPALSLTPIAGKPAPT